MTQCELCRQFSPHDTIMGFVLKNKKLERDQTARELQCGIRWICRRCVETIAFADAEAAYAEAPAEPLSDERIKELVRYATGTEDTPCSPTT